MAVEAAFDQRFVERRQAERYRDRYRTGRRVGVHERECAVLRTLLSGVGRLATAMDLPCGTGRLSAIVGEHADRMILADSSLVMLELAREEPELARMEFLQADATKITLPDGAVDLVFCHRMLPHIYDRARRVCILGELARVARRYVVLSFYPPGWRRRLKWWFKSLLGRVQKCDQQATMSQFLSEAGSAGLHVRRRETLRRFPAGAFFLLEKDSRPTATANHARTGRGASALNQASAASRVSE